MGCGLKASKDNFSCSSLNAFKEIRVSSRTIIKNDITIINDGQNICTIEYKKCIPGKEVFNLFQRVKYMWVLFFAHFPFVVKRVFNATPTETVAARGHASLLAVTKFAKIVRTQGVLTGVGRDLQISTSPATDLTVRRQPDTLN